VFTATLITGISFFLFISMPFWVWAILRRWFACSPTAYQVVCEVESLRNTGLIRHVRITENDWKQIFTYHYISIRKQHTDINEEPEQVFCRKCIPALFYASCVCNTYPSFHHHQTSWSSDYLPFLIRIWEVPGSNLDPVTLHPNRGFSWLSSVPPGKCWDSTLNVGHDRFCQVTIYLSPLHGTLFVSR
jgi:hypothetical protein